MYCMILWLVSVCVYIYVYIYIYPDEDPALMFETSEIISFYNKCIRTLLLQKEIMII